LGGCAAENVLTTAEKEKQSAADYQVASLLFEKDLSANASYKVSKNGFVNIVFDKSVPFSSYDDIVQALRANKTINGVRAEQEGVEVCPLP
jgi:hypothetical protein